MTGEKDRIKFNLFVHKEPDYIMMLMSTYGTCIEHQNQQESRRSWIDTIKMARVFYKEVVTNHYLYKGSVDFHIGCRHDGRANQGLSIEETWDTKYWENHIFAFIIAITEVNAYIAMAQFHDNREGFVIFRRN